MSVAPGGGVEVQRPGPTKTKLPRLPSFDIFLSSFSPIATTGKKGLDTQGHSVPPQKPTTLKPQASCTACEADVAQPQNISLLPGTPQVQSSVQVAKASTRQLDEESADRDSSHAPYDPAQLVDTAKGTHTPSQHKVRLPMSSEPPPPPPLSGHPPDYRKTQIKVGLPSTLLSTKCPPPPPQLQPPSIFSAGAASTHASKMSTPNDSISVQTFRTKLSPTIPEKPDPTLPQVQDQKICTTTDSSTMTDPPPPAATTATSVENKAEATTSARRPSGDDSAAESKTISTKEWSAHFKSLPRMDKFVCFEQFLNDQSEDTQEMLLEIFKKLPVFYSVEDLKGESGYAGGHRVMHHNTESPRNSQISGEDSQRDRINSVSSLHSRSSYHSHGESSKFFRGESEEEEDEYDEDALAILEKYSGKLSRSNDEAEDLDESDDHYGGLSDQVGDDSENDNESDYEMSADAAYYHDDDDYTEEESEEEEEVVPGSDSSANTSLRKSIAKTLAMGGRPPVEDDEREENILAQLLNFCQCDISSFVLNPLPSELGMINCFLWYDRPNSRIELYIDGRTPILLLEANCTEKKVGQLEFSISTPSWHSNSMICKLLQVQSSHVSHFNVFDARDPAEHAHTSSRRGRLEQKSYVPAAGVGGGLYSRVAASQQQRQQSPEPPAAVQLADRDAHSNGPVGPMQLGAVQIKSISTKPRELLLLTPLLIESANDMPIQRESSIGDRHAVLLQSRLWDSADPDEQMLQVALRGERDDLNIMHSRAATFDSETQAYTMDFGERVKFASSKNVILQEYNGDGSTRLMTGKIDTMQYAVDFTHPLSPVLAFATCISNIVTQTQQVDVARAARKQRRRRFRKN